MHWSKDEIKDLKEATKAFGVDPKNKKNFKSVVNYMQSRGHKRNRKQIYEKISDIFTEKRRWSEYEIDIVMKFIPMNATEHGYFAIVANMLEKRSANDVKNLWNTYVKRKHKMLFYEVALKRWNTYSDMRKNFSKPPEKPLILEELEKPTKRWRKKSGNFELESEPESESNAKKSKPTKSKPRSNLNLTTTKKSTPSPTSPLPPPPTTITTTNSSSSTKKISLAESEVVILPPSSYLNPMYDGDICQHDFYSFMYI